VLAEFQTSFSEGEDLTNADHDVVKKAFHAALANAPGDAHLLSTLAMFTWKLLGDFDTAEELYTKALELAPHDPDIQANYALFLWQCDS
jgi:Tfp pilus assembly protein PilF